jgi:hypothetical protein
MEKLVLLHFASRFRCMFYSVQSVHRGLAARIPIVSEDGKYAYVGLGVTEHSALLYLAYKVSKKLLTPSWFIGIPLI